MVEKHNRFYYCTYIFVLTFILLACFGWEINIICIYLFSARSTHHASPRHVVVLLSSLPFPVLLQNIRIDETARGQHEAVPSNIYPTHLSSSTFWSNCLLKLPIDSLLTMCLLSLFQSFITLLVNQYLPVSVLNLSFSSMYPFPRVLSWLLDSKTWSMFPLLLAYLCYLWTVSYCTVDCVVLDCGLCGSGFRNTSTYIFFFPKEQKKKKRSGLS